MTHELLFASVVILGLLLSGAAHAQGIHPAAVDDFAAIQRNERTDRYLLDLDRAADNALDTLDPDTGLIRLSDLVPPDQFEWSVAELDRHERKRHITPEYSRFYTLGRVSASSIGLLGEAYALPLSRFHRDPRLLQAVRKGLEAFTTHQHPGGEWVFCPLRFSTVYGSHEMAWRLEPLLRAYVAVQADLPPQERDRYGAMLERAADFLLRTPCTHQCNRGVVWSGVMAMAYAMIGKQEYLDAARANWAHVRPVVFPDSGQVLEGPGPDHGYSPISVGYALLYRLMSGDATVDDVLIRSLNWVPRLYDANGVPFAGMSTRHDATSGNLEGYLPALEYYASREPMFDQLAGDYLRRLERRRGFSAWHGGAHALRAALFHGARPEAAEARVPDYFQVYQAEVSIYAAVRRRYQTVVNLRSRQPRNGLQMWTYDREKPVVCPTPKRSSGTETSGYTSWLADIKEGDGYRVSPSDLDALAVELSGQYAFYVFSPVSTVVIYAGPETPRKTRWVLSKDETAEPVIADGRVGFAGQASALYYAGGAPLLRDERDARVLEFARPAGEPEQRFDWYAFSGGPFETISCCEPTDGPIAFGFADATGAYLALCNPSRSSWTGSVALNWPEPRVLEATLSSSDVRVIALGDARQVRPPDRNPPPAAEPRAAGADNSSPGASP